MTCSCSRNLILPLCGLALACGGDSFPTQPDGGGIEGVPDASSALAAGSWAPRAALPSGATGFSLAVVPNGSGQSIALAIGGRLVEATGFRIAAYDVAANTWTSRNTQVSVELLNGVGKIGNRIYFSGGYAGSGLDATAQRALYAYDFRNDRIIRKADMPKFTADGVTGVIDNKLYVLPGVCDANRWPVDGYCETEAINKLYRYDPSTDTWLGRRPAPNYHRGGGAGVIGGKLYVVGGFHGFTPVKALDVYDPVTNTWTTRAPIPLGGRATATVFQNKLFVVVSAVENNTVVSRAYLYNPSTNAWKSQPVPPVASAIARVLLNGTARVLAVNGTGDDTSPLVPSYLFTP